MSFEFLVEYYILIVELKQANSMKRIVSDKKNLRIGMNIEDLTRVWFKVKISIS